MSISRFVGEYRSSLDADGRVVIPLAFRRALSPAARETFAVSKGYDGCLWGRPLDDWDRFVTELRTLSTNEKKMRLYIQAVLAQASIVPIGSKGRIHIPKRFRDYADIQDKVVIIGVIDKIEFWSSERYGEYMEDGDVALEEIGEELRDL